MVNVSIGLMSSSESGTVIVVVGGIEVDGARVFNFAVHLALLEVAERTGVGDSAADTVVKNVFPVEVGLCSAIQMSRLHVVKILEIIIT